MRHLHLALLFVFGCAPDLDGDGSRRADCDDENALIHPNTIEICDGVDNDCDGFVDEGVSIVAFWDRDGDGFGDDQFGRRVCVMPADGSDRAGDCNDLNAAIHPDAEERCNAIDDNCDRQVDEGVTRSFFIDADGDGHGSAAPSEPGCAPGENAALTNDDCDDADSSVWDGAPELCDGLDNDCNGHVDDNPIPTARWADADNDGFGDPASQLFDCQSEGVLNADDCDDTDDSVHPDATEIRSNSADEDCDGFIDELAVGGAFNDIASALAVAGDGDVVQLGPGTWFEAVDLLDRDITFAGSGCERTLLYGDGSDRVLHMNMGELHGLTIGGGAAENGGGLLVSGPVRAKKICVESNYASQHGGGIAVAAGGVLTLLDATIAQNQANDYGGGIWVSDGGQLIAERVTLIENSALSGGGLCVDGGDARVDASQFLANKTIGTQYRNTSARGGAVAVRGLGQATLENINFVANQSIARGQIGYISSGELSINNAVAAYNSVDPLILFYRENNAAQRLSNMVSWSNNDREEREGPFEDALREAPRFVHFDPLTSPSSWDLHLLPDSPLIGQGDPTVLNPNQDPSDFGGYGGPKRGDHAGDSYELDSDSDGLFNGWEQHWSLNPWADDASLDPDGDGLTNAEEAQLNTSPHQVDSDSDGVSDFIESTNGTNPNDPSDQRPLAEAGQSRWTPVGRLIQLNGDLSLDPNGDPLSYSWTLVPPAGGSPVVVNADQANASFSPDITGHWVATLEVSDGLVSSSDSVDFWVGKGNVVPDDYPTLSEAIAATSPGASVFISPGTYHENIDLDRDVNLIGLGQSDEVQIIGDLSRSVLRVGDDRQIVLAHLSLSRGLDADGAGVHAGKNVTLSLHDVHLHHNSATGRGGGLYLYRGQLQLTDAHFSDNQAARGGGLFLDQSPVQSVRSRFNQNIATEQGGAVLSTGGSELQHHFENGVFQGNRAPEGAAIYQEGTSSDLYLQNVGVFDHQGAGATLFVRRGRLRPTSSVFAHNHTASIFGRSGTALTSWVSPIYSAYWQNDGTLSALADDGLGDEPGTLTEDPRWIRWSDDGLVNDLLIPGLRSSLINNGLPESSDRDGSRVDIGPSGGPNAAPGVEWFTRDSDSDGMSDGWEREMGLTLGVDDASDDPDGDSLSNAEEFTLGTNPQLADSDLDGLSDSEELALNMDPTRADDNRPTARSDGDKRARLDQLLVLDGGLSTDPNNDPLTFEWSLLSAPPHSAITNQSLNRSNSTLRFYPDARGLFLFQLVVADPRAPSLPLTVQVNAVGDLHVPANFSTLDDALNDALSGDTIVLAAGRYHTSLSLKNREVHLKGAGADASFLVGTDANGILSLTDSSSLFLEDIGLVSGVGSYGGALNCEDSSVHAERVLFAQNVAYKGGAISLQGCDATLIDVELAQNRSYLDGGAIYSSGSVINGTRLTAQKNEAGSGGGALYLYQSSGQLTNALLHHNVARGSGGAVYQRYSDVETSFSTIADNAGQNAAWYVNSGAGSVHHSVFAGHSGYHLYALNNSSLSAHDNAWSGQRGVPAAPSALYSVGLNLRDDPRFVSADDYHLWGSSPLVDRDPSCVETDGSACDLGAYGGPDATPDFNRASVDLDNDGLPDAWELKWAQGDPLADDDSDGLNTLAELLAQTSPIEADTDQDGVDDWTELINGTSPLVADDLPTAIISADVVVEPNESATLVGTASSPISGSALSYRWTLVNAPLTSQATVASPTQADLVFTPDVPGAFVFNLIVNDGLRDSRPTQSVIYARGDLLVPEDYLTVAEAYTAVQSGFAIHLADGVYPTEIVLEGVDLHLIGAGPARSVLEGLDQRSIIWADHGESIILENLDLTNGLSTLGAAIYTNGGPVQLNQVRFGHNRAIMGGAIYAKTSDITGDALRFTENQAARYGGAIYHSTGSLSLNQALFAQNEAVSQNGGAIYAMYVESAFNTAIFSNNAARYGGALYLGSSSSTPQQANFKHITATYNSSSRGGSFLQFSRVQVSVENSLIAFNGDGQAFYRNSSINADFTQSNSLVWANSAGHYKSIDDPTGLNGNIESAPRLWEVSDDGDWSNDDWSLKPSSPAIGQATDLNPDGGAGDIGAFGGPLAHWIP